MFGGLEKGWGIERSKGVWVFEGLEECWVFGGLEGVG